MTEARADEDVTTDEPAPRVAGGRRKAKRRTTGCIPVLIVLAVLAGLGWYGVDRGMGFIESRFGDPDDYAGPGSGQVLFQVESGDTLTAMGENLVAADVVAFMDAQGIRRAAVVGHSMGSIVAREVARLAPARLSHLVLVGGSAGLRNEVVLALRKDVDALADDPQRRRGVDREAGHQQLDSMRSAYQRHPSSHVSMRMRSSRACSVSRSSRVIENGANR